MNTSIDLFDVDSVDISETAILHGGTHALTVTVRGVDGTSVDLNVFGPDAITIHIGESA